MSSPTAANTLTKPVNSRVAIVFLFLGNVMIGSPP
jgi:hypothetical protein